jgi:AraC-like DNA-binding protein
MKLCHVEEHTSCFQYGANEAAIEILEIKEGEEHQIFSDSNEILYVIEGVFNISNKKTENLNIKTGETILIPLHSPSVIRAITDVKIMVMKLNFNITFCDRLPLELLLETHGKLKKNSIDQIEVLEPNLRLSNFVDTMLEYTTDGLKCTFFFDIKIREFLFLIRAYYDKHIVFNFFKPIYNTDFVFSNSIYKNIDDAKTVKELANLLNYSLSGFEKKFKKVFNASPYQWIQEQKAKKIYHEINCSKKSFTEMAFDFDFSSPAHFNVFCKQFFGKTPGDLRKENTERTSTLFK